MEDNLTIKEWLRLEDVCTPAHVGDQPFLLPASTPLHSLLAVHPDTTWLPDTTR